MRKYLSIPAIVLLWVIVHVDWHLARSRHHRLSLEWREHWTVGLVAFFLLVLFCAWKWPEGFVGAAVLNGLIGLFVGHIGEAWLEALREPDPLSAVLTPERWRAFFEFSLAGAAGLLVGMLVIYGYRRWRPSQEMKKI